MSGILHFNVCKIKVCILLLLISFVGFSQDIQVVVLGGEVVDPIVPIEITAGNSITFRITNIRLDCDKVKIEDITLSNPTDFSISTDQIPKNVDNEDCKGKTKYIDFVVTNTSGNCGATTNVNILIKKNPDFVFTFSISGSPQINVLGGSPSADILDGSTITSATNGTYFGIIDEGASITRNFVIANTGSCPLDITGLSSTVVSGSGFSIAPIILVPPSYNLPTAEVPTVSVNPGSFVIILVTFTGPLGGTGTQEATINVANTANTTFSFNVRAEMFNFNIPGPGGVTADFRLWLNTARGVTKDVNSKVSKWADVGTNPKNAIQTVVANQPTYLDNATSNINFNPVIEFQNDGTASLNQFLYNDTNGFYSQEIFVVMESDVDVTSSSGMTIFSGSIADILTPENYVDDIDDVTGVGLGDFTTNLTGERLWYNQGSSASNPFYALPASSSRTYNTAGIINAGNKSATISDGMRILYNSIDDAVSSTKTITTFENVGYIDTVPDPDVILGTPYNIGKNKNTTLGNLNGRVAEIFTFASRLSDPDRQKIESYLAIKYGIALGASNEVEKDYINSFGTSVWDILSNTGFNYDVAGIGRDDDSDLNQKQSKSINLANEVTIGLNGIFSTNSANPNEFDDDGDFLVWGNNNGAFTGTNINAITIGSAITTTLTRIDRKWKIVESTQAVGGDVGTVYVGIPTTAFSGFAKTADEEYVLIVADDPTFDNSNIIDVIPLKINVNPTTGSPILDANGNEVYKTWYDFHDTKYFTFGKAAKLSENHAISIGLTDYLVGEYALNLNVNDFTISAWVKADATQTSVRTIMAKGSKLQLRLNTSHQIEVMVDNDITPRFTSTMVLNDNKWHQITFVYNSGTIFLYVDGVLDKSEQNVVAPSPNYNYFSIGALYIDKSTIINPFLGRIDEVYVWDQGLTEKQVRYLMNQEVEKGTGGFVTGKKLPQAASSNQIPTISWSKLKAYYDFNSFYGSTVEGLTDSRNFLRLKYLNKDKTLLDTQSIPVDYVSIADGDWDSPSTWSNSADNLLPNALSLDGVTYIDWNIVEINHNIESGDKDITVLALKINSGKLTIADPVVVFPVEDNAGQVLTITNYLELDGVIDLVGESQLIQTEGSIIDADSGGYLERDQQGTANGFNYNYWSSSVGPIPIGGIGTSGTGIAATNANHTIEEVLKNGTDSEVYADLIFDSSASGGTTPPPGLDRTVSTYWTYKFYGDAGDYYSWEKINEASSLNPGEGFTMKGTSGAVPISDKQNYVFIGLPNNGDITLPLNNTLGDVDRLVGNPYPSAIDATEFILDNLGVADGGNNINGNIINGALYFWDHFGQENSHVLKEYVGGYATRNLTGGAVAISNDSRINNTSNAGSPATGTKVPGQFIPVNQGFFVSTALDGFNNDNDPVAPITTVIGGDIVFKNSQRVFAREDGSTSLFLKSTKNKVSKGIGDTKKTKRKSVIKLMYDSPEGYHRQIVIGVNKNASLGFDIGYDAFMADVNKEDMYWTFNNSKFVIQGVNNFNDDQEFPIGLIVNNGGLIKIKIDDLENIDINKSIYIKDNLTEETYQINEIPFEIYLEAGTYNDRFKLVFQSTQKSLDVNDLTLENNFITYYDNQNSNLSIILKSDAIVNKGSILTILGQEIQAIDKFSNRMSIPLKVSNGAYIIQLETDRGLVNKKIIIK